MILLLFDDSARSAFIRKNVAKIRNPSDNSTLSLDIALKAINQQMNVANLSFII